MACGGFSQNPELMKRIAAVRPVLSTAPEESETGGGLELGLDSGLKIGNPYCWWVPVLKLYDDRKEEKPGPDLWAYHPTVNDRAWPGGIMVNADGKRFMNEAEAYNTAGGRMAMDEDPRLDTIWLIWGHYYIKNYIRGNVSWLQPAKSWMNKSKSVEELSDKTGLPLENLKQTLARWNEMAALERDDDFHRGESAYDHFMGDEFREGNPNIAPVEAPFQAVRLYPGCLSTKMGPVTDEYGRVFSEKDALVTGLYAAGNAAGSFLGNTYPGAGGTIGPAVVFGYRAGKHAAGKDE
jgi:succinate dehydrogenase/fumarate reductase flavoprotein subunit